MRKESGFTLIELMIVVVILGFAAMIVVPSISNTFRFSVKSASADLATLIKDTVNSAQITGKIHRVAYDLKEQKYWVEFTGEEALLQNDESKEYDKNRPKSFFSKNDDDEKKKNGGFIIAKSLTSKKRSLPIGVTFKDVLTEQSDELITTGIAYTHVFPHGITEQSLIHLIDTGKNEESLMVSNLLGRCRLEHHYVDAKEAFQGAKSK